MLNTNLKKLTTNILLGLFTSSILFTGFELALRIFLPQNLINNEPIYIADPVIEKRLIASSQFRFQNAEYRYTVKTNNEGFRDRYHNKQKPENVRRILIIGDSFTYGPGVAQNKIYPALLEESLNTETAGFKYEVLTMACGGFGPEHYAAILKNIGLQYKPDLVILGIYVDNDVTDTMDLGDELIPEERSFLFNLLYPINNFLEERSHAFIFIRARLDYPLWVLGLRPYYFPDVFWKKIPPNIETDWQRTFQVIGSIQNLCSESKIALMPVIIPAIYQVDKKIWGDYLSIYDINLDKVDISLPQKRFTSFFKKEGIRSLDLLPDFKKNGGGREGQLYFPIDRHWNEAGHELCAKKIRGAVQSAPEFP